MTIIKVDDQVIEFSTEEWKFIKKYFLEECLEMNASLLVDFGELGEDLCKLEGEEKIESVFRKNVNIFNKLKIIGINVYGLDQILSNKEVT